MAVPTAREARMEKTLKFLNGPSLEVKITSEAGETRTWNICKALLSEYFGCFQRAGRLNTFAEGDTNKVKIPGFEPDTFGMFVEFLHYGRYRYKDDLTNHRRIRENAKVWVLGDCLDAVEFKNFAIRSLYSIYIPSRGDYAKAGIGPEMVDYCCSNSACHSSLSSLVLTF